MHDVNHVSAYFGFEFVYVLLLCLAFTKSGRQTREIKWDCVVIKAASSIPLDLLVYPSDPECCSRAEYCNLLGKKNNLLVQTIFPDIGVGADVIGTVQRIGKAQGDAFQLAVYTWKSLGGGNEANSPIIWRQITPTIFVFPSSHRLSKKTYSIRIRRATNEASRPAQIVSEKLESIFSCNSRSDFDVPIFNRNSTNIFPCTLHKIGRRPYPTYDIV